MVIVGLRCIRSGVLNTGENPTESGTVCGPKNGPFRGTKFYRTIPIRILRIPKYILNPNGDGNEWRRKRSGITARKYIKAELGLLL